MKKSLFEKKLILNKVTLAHLDHFSMTRVIGGYLPIDTVYPTEDTCLDTETFDNTCPPGCKTRDPLDTQGGVTCTCQAC